MYTRSLALVSIAIAGLSIFAASCAPQTAAPPAATAIVPLASPTAAPTRATSASPVASPVVSPVARSSPVASDSGGSQGTRVNGTVQDVADTTVALQGGSSFRTSEQTSVIRTQRGTPADLKAGQNVAITAQRQADGTLLASIVSTFPPSSRGPNEGQFPLSGENIMTNAIIDDAQVSSVQNDQLSVTFQGQKETVRIAPDAQILLRLPGTLADVKPGNQVNASVTEGIATQISVQ
jgi:hypothetical protein